MNLPHSSGPDAKLNPTPTVLPEGASAARAGRDSRGRFAPGSKGGPGNPFARRSAALRQAMLDAVSAEDLQAIVRRLIEKAKEGDVSAARLVLSYSVGKPDRAVDPDRLDVEEFQLWQASAVANEDLYGVMGRPQAGLANTVLRAAVPPIQETTAQSLAQQLSDPLPQPEQDAAPVAANQAGPSAETPAGLPRRQAKSTSGPRQAKGPGDSRQKGQPPATEGSEPNSGLALPEETREMLLALLDDIFHPTDEPERPEGIADPAPPSANGLLRSQG